MKPDTPVSLKIADWDQDEPVLRSIRQRVFVLEQHVPVDLEWDGLDPACIHVLACVNGELPVGTARLLDDGHIGRMAVLRPWRRHGIGSRMLRTLIEIARQQGKSDCALNAQTHALGFYERHGFVAVGEVFDDAGMPHRHMQLKL